MCTNPYSTVVLTVVIYGPELKSMDKIQTNWPMSAHNELWADINVLAQILVVAMNAACL